MSSPTKRAPLYKVTLVKPGGSEEDIIRDVTGIQHARNVALHVARGGRRRVKIYRDGKALPGGACALDDLALEQWFEKKEEEAHGRDADLA